MVPEWAFSVWIVKLEIWCQDCEFIFLPLEIKWFSWNSRNMSKNFPENWIWNQDGYKIVNNRCHQELALKVIQFYNWMTFNKPASVF